MSPFWHPVHLDFIVSSGSQKNPEAMMTPIESIDENDSIYTGNSVDQVRTVLFVRTLLKKTQLDFYNESVFNRLKGHNEIIEG